MAHNRKLVISGVALTMADTPVKESISAMTLVRDDLEREIIRSEYLEGAPFKWVGLILRKGLVDESEPHYERINAKYGDLPIAIEIDTHHLLGATSEEMVQVYRRATLLALAHVGKKYGLNTSRIDTLLEEANLQNGEQQDKG